MSVMMMSSPRGRIKERRRPFTDEQLVALAKDGDGFAMGRLIDRYKTLVRHKARPYSDYGVAREDLQQEGAIGLMKAVRDYRPERSAFRGFADLVITRHIINAIKSASRLKHLPLNSSRSLDTPIADGYHTTLIETIPSREADPEQLIIEDEALNAVAAVLRDGLSDFENAVLNAHLSGKSYSAIARSFERNTKAIDNALQRAKQKMHNNLRRLEEATPSCNQ